jgi:hypothetical protein
MEKQLCIVDIQIIHLWHLGIDDSRLQLNSKLLE